ncbi:MAG: universal stress protein [Bacteroidales bacterium]|nr:universal stress protein [Bacteroidales bacterium]MBK7175162.1 universal stress protein [Bacteroidales bacterium]
MSNIIAAIDFSDCSINALEHAISIANKGILDVHMIWVNNPSVTKTTIYSDKASDLIEEIKKQFGQLIEKYKDRLPETQLDYVIREGKVYREILDEAREMESLCIVMGTHGSSGFEQFWIGSNANRLISVAHCPVISLRAGINVKHQLERIVLPIDSTIDTRQKVPFTAYLAQLFDAEIYVVSVYASKYKAIQRRVDEYTDQVVKYLEEEGIPFHRDTLLVDNLTTSTIEYAKKVRANLISIMTEQETSPFNLLVGPYAQQMVNNSPFPVLSINPHETLIMASR